MCQKVNIVTVVLFERLASLRFREDTTLVMQAIDTLNRTASMKIGALRDWRDRAIPERKLSLWRTTLYRLLFVPVAAVVSLPIVACEWIGLLAIISPVFDRYAHQQYIRCSSALVRGPSWQSICEYASYQISSSTIWGPNVSNTGQGQVQWRASAHFS